MTLLPVVERELRVAARERNTYRVRFLAALVTILFSGFSLWFVRVAFNERPIPPRDLFLFLSWICFVFVAIAGFTLTCDTISQEKRDSTLGLLFLTDLRGYDIVLGKLAVAGARGLYALGATFPVLALPLMMGGTNLAELARTTSSLLLTLFFSMTVGLACSAFTRRNWASFGVSASILFLFTCFLPAFSQVVLSYYKNGQLAHYIQLPSPSYAMYMSFRTAAGLTGHTFERSVSLILLLAFIAIIIASLRTPHVWKDRPPAQRVARLLAALHDVKFGVAEVRASFRRQLLNRNPIFWLSRRERVSAPGLLFLLSFGACAAVWVGWQDWSFLDPEANVVLPMIAWIICGISAHIFILLRLAVIAADRFGEDRRSGALELILSTPMTIKSILSGHWMGLRRYFAGPVLLAFAFQVIVLSHMFTIEDDPEFMRTIPQIFRDIFLHLNGFPMHQHRWELHFFVLVVLTLFPVLMLDWTALAWVSTWQAMRAKHQFAAPIFALVVLHVPPFFAFVLTAGFLEGLRLLPSHNFSEVLLLFTIALTYFVANQLICLWWSRRQIYKHFRTAATDRYQLKTKRSWWRFGKMHRAAPRNVGDDVRSPC